MSNITRNLFFTATTLTSIGYGTNTPDSVAGRIFIIFYILIGIPLYLITLADLAKFCTEFLVRSYTELLKQKFNFFLKYRRWRTDHRRRQSIIEILDIIIAGGEDEIAEFLWTHLENAQFVELPFMLVYVLLLIYAIIASLIISKIEGWNIYDGFYFLMMSILTVGFGDLVPRNQKFALFTLILIIAGLILATTCIDVAGAYYINRLHFFGRRVDREDPLSWLKAVQQKRIDVMKREAMRKLFETVTALQHLRLGSQPDPPQDLIAYNSTAQSVMLHWKRPLHLNEAVKYWFTITYKTRTPQILDNPITMIDFINSDRYEVRNLKSFTLYEFTVVTTTRFGSSKPVRCQEYTEPCTVPQLLRLTAFSSETATFSWRAPRKNNGPESYVIQFSQEPAPPFHFWQRYKCGSSKTYTITGLMPNTRYIVCVSAEHNFGLAAMSKSLRFQTKEWYLDDTNEFAHESYRRIIPALDAETWILLPRQLSR
ncbi:unnamed protein product [Dracunculus medinensis]|uniref:Fibronectin type-III domain-containing protein n=1 Tax=Dracunculus medinensis TaxID=318479 RepID=A0A3P7SKQ1_DRAME|nr:unnamed protein product [Dracunculus medinensis]